MDDLDYLSLLYPKLADVGLANLTGKKLPVQRTRFVSGDGVRNLPSSIRFRHRYPSAVHADAIAPSNTPRQGLTSWGTYLLSEHPANAGSRTTSISAADSCRILFSNQYADNRLCTPHSLKKIQEAFPDVAALATTSATCETIRTLESSKWENSASVTNGMCLHFLSFELAQKAVDTKYSSAYQGSKSVNFATLSSADVIHSSVMYNSATWFDAPSGAGSSRLSQTRIAATPTDIYFYEYCPTTHPVTNHPVYGNQWVVTSSGGITTSTRTCQYTDALPANMDGAWNQMCDAGEALTLGFVDSTGEL